VFKNTNIKDAFDDDELKNEKNESGNRHGMLKFEPLSMKNKAKSETQKDADTIKSIRQNLKEKMPLRTQEINTKKFDAFSEILFSSKDELEKKKPSVEISEYTKTIILAPYYNDITRFERIYSSYKKDKEINVYKVLLKDCRLFILKTITWEGINSEKSKESIFGFMREFYNGHIIGYFSQRIAKTIDMKHAEYKEIIKKEEKMTENDEINNVEITKTQIAILSEYAGINLKNAIDNYVKYCDKETISEHKINLEKMYSIICQLASVLEIMEYVGISHMDIKPENIAFNESESQIKIIDFGAAISFIRTPEKSQNALGILNQEKICEYSREYAPPELIYAAQNYKNDPRLLQNLIPQKVDIFCFGITIAEILLAKYGIRLFNQNIYSGITPLIKLREFDYTKKHHSEFVNNLILILHWLGYGKLIYPIKLCLEYEPSKRPTFKKIKNLLKQSMILMKSGSFLDLDEMHDRIQLNQIAEELISQDANDPFILLIKKIREESMLYPISETKIHMEMLEGFAYSNIPGKSDEGIQKLNEIYKKITNENDCDYLNIRFFLGHAYNKQYNTNEAIQVFGEAEKHIIKTCTNDKSTISKIFNGLGECYFHELNFEKSCEYYKKAIDALSDKNLYNKKSCDHIMLSLAQVYIEQKKYFEAIEQLKAAEEILTKQPFSRNLQTLYCIWANLYVLTEKYTKSIECFKKILEISYKLYGEENYEIIKVHLELYCLENREQINNKHLSEAIRLLNKILQPECKIFNIGFEMLLKHLIQIGNTKAAIDFITNSLQFHKDYILQNKVNEIEICEYILELNSELFTKNDFAINYLGKAIQIIESSKSVNDYNKIEIYIFRASYGLLRENLEVASEQILCAFKTMKNSSTLHINEICEFIDTSFNIICNYSEKQEYKAALILLEEINEKYDSLLCKAYKKHKILDEIGYCYEQLDKIELAIKFYNNGLIQMENEKLAKDVFKLTILKDLCRVYENKEKYEIAADYAKMIYEKQKQIYGEQSFKTIDASIKVGRLYKKTKNYVDSEKYLRIAFELDKKEYGIEHILTLNRYYEHANIYYSLQNYDKALRNLYKIKYIIEKKHLEKNKSFMLLLINVYGSLGNIYNQNYCYKNSIEFYEKEKYLYTLLNQTPDLLTVLKYENIAFASRNAKYYDKAIENHLKAIELIKQIPSYFNSVQKGQRYHYLGISYSIMNNFQKAIDNFDQAIEIYKKGINLDNYSFADTQIQLGIAYIKSKDAQKKDQAHYLYNQALDIFGILPNKFQLFDAYCNISNGFRFIKNYNEAIKYDLKALDTIKKLCPAPIDLAKIYKLLGQDYNNIKKNDEAIKMLNESLQIYKEIYANKKNKNKIDDNINVASLYNDFGNSYFNLKQYKNAIDYYKASLEIYFRLFTDKIYGHYMIVYMNLGKTYFIIGDYENSIHILNKYYRLVENLETANKTLQISALKQLIKVYKKIIEIENYNKKI